MGKPAFVLCPFSGLSRRAGGCYRRTEHHCLRWRQTRARTVLVIKGCDDSRGSKQHEPVEDGVELPAINDKGLDVQCSWLEIEIRSWLDSEWPESKAIKAHRDIAHRTSQLYRRLRVEGMHDLGTILLGLGAGLEGSDFSKTYIGAWTVANKAADLLLRQCAPARFEHEEKQERTAPAPPPEQVWSLLDEIEVDKSASDTSRRAASPGLADEFERYRFLQMILDGSASKRLIDGAVAVAMGFHYNKSQGTWDGSSVEDDHFKQFGDEPPDILGNENEARWTDSLRYLEKQIDSKKEEEQGDLEASLQIVLETLHGVELTQLQMKDEKDYSFKKRVTVAKWLHLLGGF